MSEQRTAFAIQRPLDHCRRIVPVVASFPHRIRVTCYVYYYCLVIFVNFICATQGQPLAGCMSQLKAIRLHVFAAIYWNARVAVFRIRRGHNTSCSNPSSRFSRTATAYR